MLLTAAVTLATRAWGAEWPPITPEQLHLSAALVDSSADAEAVSWDVWVEDRFDGGQVSTVLDQQLRIKVFNERGKKQASRIDIPYLAGCTVEDVAARTTLPDGSTIKLRSQDVFERTLIKAGHIKVKAKSFVFPGVEPGAILDCRWHEVRWDEAGLSGSFEFQRDIPVQRVTYHVKPLVVSGGPLVRFATYNAAIPPLEPTSDGYLTTTLHNVHAFREEPHMPPEADVRPWMLVYYSDNTITNPDVFWQDIGKRLYGQGQDLFKKTPESRDVATRIVGDATRPVDQLRRLYDHCRHEIRNLDFDPIAGSPPKSAHEVLNQKQGTSSQILELFGSLASSLGLDVRMAYVTNRRSGRFERASMNPLMLNAQAVAVRVGDDWQFFDPGQKSLPFGMLPWQEEGQDALIPDPRTSSWVAIPSSAAEQSCTRRVGVFRLQADGTLVGTAQCQYSGHAGVEQKESYEDMSADAREKALLDDIRAQLPTAEVSDVLFQNAAGPLLPYGVAYTLKVPSYAQVTGKRLFFQPAVFQHGRKLVFDSTDRWYPVDFDYRWSEDDSLVIQLPDGYALDNPDAPGDIDAGSFGSYKVREGIANDGTLLVYRRSFRVDKVRIGRGDYASLKGVFDAVHERDEHALAVRKNEP